MTDNSRRQFLTMGSLACGMGGLVLTHEGPQVSWRVFLRGVSPEVTINDRVFDAVTGEDVSSRFPIRNVRRMRVSLESQRPRRMVIYRVNDRGLIYLEDDLIAADVVPVLVVRKEVACSGVGSI